MGTGANKALAMRYVELWNTGNLALADEVLALDFVDHTHPELAPGPEAVKQEVTAFPEAHVTIEQMIREGDTVAFRFVLRGTHQETFGRFPPTGKEVVLTGWTPFVLLAASLSNFGVVRIHLPGSSNLVQSSNSFLSFRSCGYLT